MVADKEPRIRVLLIEDDEPILCVLTRSVAMIGGHVTAVLSGDAGIEALNRERFDLVVTDLKMGRVSGLDVAAWISEHQTGLPVVVTSGYATVEDQCQIAELGAVLLRKPYSPQLLYAAMDEARSYLSRLQSPNVDTGV